MTIQIETPVLIALIVLLALFFVINSVVQLALRTRRRKLLAYFRGWKLFEAWWKVEPVSAPATKATSDLPQPTDKASQRHEN